MGIDFLEMTLHLEKEHGMRLERDALAVPKQKGVSAGERLAEMRRRMGMERVVCKRLGYFRAERWDIRVERFYLFLRDHCHPMCEVCAKQRESCAACMAAGAERRLTWEQFVESLSWTVGKKAADISKDAWVMGDLGFS